MSSICFQVASNCSTLFSLVSNRLDGFHNLWCVSRLIPFFQLFWIDGLHSSKFGGQKNATSHHSLSRHASTTLLTIGVNREPLLAQPCMGVPTHLVQAMTDRSTPQQKPWCQAQGRSACDRVAFLQVRRGLHVNIRLTHAAGPFFTGHPCGHGRSRHTAYFPHRSALHEGERRAVG